MTGRIFALIEPFIVILLATVILASIFPARGFWAVVVNRSADAGIIILFFLHGAKLSRAAIWEGARNWRLHIATLGMTFVLFPALGVALRTLSFIPREFAVGLLYLTLLPSTVQSSIAFTAIARGNVAAAVCAASFSNLVGIVLTPALVAIFLGGAAGISWSSAQTILLQLLLPFIAGHLARPWIGAFVTRHKTLLSRVDRGSILLVVYSSFGAAVVQGLWHQVTPTSLLLLIALGLLLLSMVIAVAFLLGRLLGFPREDAIVLLFCGSKKSLASGVPMAGVLFASTQVGIVLLPVMVFHQLQLIACALIAPRLALQAAPSVAEAA
jgi:sodium/bile acid cotransporter 7